MKIIINYYILYVYTNGSEINEKIDILIYIFQIDAAQKRYLGDNNYFIIYFKKLKEIDIIYQIVININLLTFII